MSPVDPVNRRRNLDRAIWVKARRAEFKRKLKMKGRDQGRLLVADLITDVPPWARNIEVGDLLTWVPTFGPCKRNQILRSLGLNPIRRLGGLHSTTKALLAAELKP